MPGPVPGVVRIAEVDAAEEREARRALLRARTRVGTACAHRERPPREPCDAASEAMVLAAVDLASLLCDGWGFERDDAMGSLEGLFSERDELVAALHAASARACVREGGDEESCELLEGQAYEELARAEGAIEAALDVVDIEAMATECDPEIQLGSVDR